MSRSTRLSSRCDDPVCQTNGAAGLAAEVDAAEVRREYALRILLAQGDAYPLDVLPFEGSLCPGGGEIGAEDHRVRIDGRDLSQRVGRVEIQAPETRRFDESPALDQAKYMGEPFSGETQVVDADARQVPEVRLELGQIAGVDVELDVPPRELVDPLSEPSQRCTRSGHAAPEIEAHRPNPEPIEPEDLRIARALLELRHPDVAWPEGAQSVLEIALIEGVKRARHDGAALDRERGDGVAVGLDAESRWPVAAIHDQREARFDDVQVCIEHSGLAEGARLRYAPCRAQYAYSHTVHDRLQ